MSKRESSCWRCRRREADPPSDSPADSGWGGKAGEPPRRSSRAKLILFSSEWGYLPDVQLINAKLWDLDGTEECEEDVADREALEDKINQVRIIIARILDS